MSKSLVVIREQETLPEIIHAVLNGTHHCISGDATFSMLIHCAHTLLLIKSKIEFGATQGLSLPIKSKASWYTV